MTGKMQKGVIYFLIFIVPIFLCSCAKKAIVKILENDLLLEGNIPQYESFKVKNKFDGLTNLLEGKSPKTLNILIVPSATSKEWDLYGSLISRISEKISPKFVSMSVYSCDSQNNNPENANSKIGKGEIVVLNFLSNEKDSVKFYITNWTKINDPIKKDLKSFELEPDAIRDTVHRTYLSKKIKNRYMLDMIADLALYRQPNFRNEIVYSIVRSFEIINKGFKDNDRFVCITESMGSEIILDSFKSLIYSSEILLEVHEKFVSNSTPFNNNFEQALYSVIAQSVEFKNKSNIDNLLFQHELDQTISKVKELEDLKIGTQDLKNEYFKERIKQFQKRIDLGKDIGEKLDQFFMLNNHLVFSNILDYSSEEYANNVAIGQQVSNSLSSLIRLKNDPEFKVISFFDPNDIIGFNLPDDSVKLNLEIKENPIINFPIIHSLEWSIDANRLRKNYLAKLPIGESKEDLMALVANNDKLNIAVSLDGPYRLARTNPKVIDYIVNGYIPEEQPAPITFNHDKSNINKNNNNAEHLYSYDTINGIIWKNFRRKFLEKDSLKKNWKAKKISTQRLLRTFYKLSQMIRPVDLPYVIPPDKIFSYGNEKRIVLDGIRQAMSAEYRSDTNYVLTVHGMSSKNPNHFDQMVEDIASELGFRF